MFKIILKKYKVCAMFESWEKIYIYTDILCDLNIIMRTLLPQIQGEVCHQNFKYEYSDQSYKVFDFAIKK